ncbi:hypothetical protein [Sorangium sp. So ce233]|uniref:hypothetical protein n=1 Tax=Sorangium sp. So ce233 TaxID=3133290 RepID=UPI003F61F87E
MGVERAECRKVRPARGIQAEAAYGITNAITAAGDQVADCHDFCMIGPERQQSNESEPAHMSHRRSVENLFGIGFFGGTHKSLWESMHKADMSLGGVNAMQRGLLESMRKAGVGLGGMNSMQKGVLESMRKAGMGLGGMNSMQKGVLESMRKAGMGLGVIGGAHKELSESMRNTGTGLGVASGMHKTIISSMLLAGTGLGIADDATRTWTKSFSAMAGFASEHYSVGSLGGAIAAVGLAGRFDLGLTSAAVAVARFLEDEADKEEGEVEGARGQSVLVDAIAEVGTFAQQAACASPEDIQKYVAVALEAVDSKFAERLASAKPAERMSLVNLLMFVLAVIGTLATVYFGQVAKDAADSSTHDAVELRAAISRASERQVDELKQIRSSVDRLAEKINITTDDDGMSGMWVVERAAKVMSGKSTKSVKVAELYPNQVVATVQVEHKWVRVEYYDYVNDVSRTGWVLKKYLRRLRSRTSSGLFAQP